MDKKGSITVFLAMILVSVCALLGGIAESARTAGARCYLLMAMDSSMDSLMSQYHRPLWENYRLLGLETDEKGRLEEEFRQFAEPYMKAENWYPMEIKEAKVTDLIKLTEGDGKYLEQEILDYMKYGLIGEVWDSRDETGAAKLMADLKEAEGVSRVSELYEGHAKEAVKLEKSLERIKEVLDGQKSCLDGGRDALASLDGDAFIREAKKLIKELEKLPSCIDRYEKLADQLAEALKDSRSRFEGETDVREELRQALEEEIRQYESYTDEEGSRRQEITALRTKGPERISFVNSCISEAEDIIDYIDSWEPDDEEDELDEEELWSPLLSRWESYALLELPMEFGIRDKEKEGWLEQVRNMAGGNLLSLVLPEGSVVSAKTLRLDGLPSASYRENASGTDSRGVGNVLDRLIVCEYLTRYFKKFQKVCPEEEFYELEYLLNGSSSDRENLSAVLARLTALRTGLNLASILADSEKRGEARTLALAITGGTGILPLVSVMTFFIMSQWALGEALQDDKCLLSGGKVPLLKGKGDWKLDLDGLLEVGKNRKLMESGETEETRGLDYTGYLRILLFSSYGREMIYRAMDVMQLVIGRSQPGFAMEDCACLVDMEGTVRGKHLFFSLGLWKNLFPEGEKGYETVMEVSGDYFDSP